jgi:hypothetical protein
MLSSSEIRKLAEDHWMYNERVLLAVIPDMNKDWIRAIKTYYIESFCHGFKHGFKESRD